MNQREIWAQAMAIRRKVTAALRELTPYEQRRVRSNQVYQEYEGAWRKVLLARRKKQLENQLIDLLTEYADKVISLKQQALVHQDNRIGKAPTKRIPWSEIGCCRSDTSLQSLHSLGEAKEKYLEKASPCPKCGTPPAGLAWLYFLESRGFPREGGWMTVCDEDQSKVDYFINRREYFAWEAVDRSRNDAELQARHSPFGPGRSNQLCPNCGRSPGELIWIWFESSERSWRSLAGRAGWLLICDACRIQVDFNLMRMS